MTKTILLLAVMLSGALSAAAQTSLPRVAPSSNQNEMGPKSVPEAITQLTHEELNQTLDSTKPSLVYFYSSAYGDNEFYLKLISAAARRHAGKLAFYKIDVEDGHEAGNALDVRDSYALVSFRALLDPPDEDEGFNLSKLSSLYVRDGTFTERDLEQFIQDTLRRKGVERDQYLDRLTSDRFLSDAFLGKPVVLHLLNDEVSATSGYRDQELFANVARKLSDRAVFLQGNLPMFSVDDFDNDGKPDGNWLVRTGNGFVDGQLRLDPTSPREVLVGRLKRKNGMVRFYPSAVTQFSSSDRWESFIEAAVDKLEEEPADGMVRPLTDEMKGAWVTTKPVLIYFYSTYFGDREHYLKLFEAAARRHAGRLEFFKMDVDRNTIDYDLFVRDSYALASYRTQDGTKPSRDEFFASKLSSLSVREGTFTELELEQFIQDTLSGKSPQRVLQVSRLEMDRAYSEPFLETNKPVVIQIVNPEMRATDQYWMQEYFANMARQYSDKAVFMQIESSQFCCDIDGQLYDGFIELSGNDYVAQELKRLGGDEVIIGRLKRSNGKVRFYPEQMFDYLLPSSWDVLLEKAIDRVAAKP